MRVVIDTNVLLSALRGGSTRAILEALSTHRFTIFISEPLLRELRNVLSRPEWLNALEPSDCHELLGVIQEAATFITPFQRVTVCRDPEDDALLECALAGRADYLGTGDKARLVLHPCHGLAILRPAEFLRLLR
jgi:putative PIN family toxin of toxin-antitoxin system